MDGNVKSESMITIQKSFNVEEARIIPADLRQWFDSLAIVGFVLQAQAFMDYRNLHTNLPEQTIVSGQANALLAVLAYCYASDMPSSQELERSSETDPIIRYLCSNRLPEVSTIRRFRRHNREQLEKCLMNVFRLARLSKVELFFLTDPRICWSSEG